MDRRDTRPRRTAASRTARTIGLGLLALAASAGLRADDSDTVDYRRHIMKTLNEQLGAISMILDRRAPADALAPQAQALAATATAVQKAFEASIPGGHSKPEVWTSWPDFLKHVAGLSAATAELAKADAASAAGAKARVDAACKECHDRYRVPTKSAGP